MSYEDETHISFPDPGMIASRDGMRARDPWEMEPPTRKQTMATTKAETQAERWNERYPAGTQVTYHTASKQIATRTKGEAFVLSGHTACIFVEDIRGCVALSALIPEYDTT